MPNVAEFTAHFLARFTPTEFHALHRWAADSNRSAAAQLRYAVTTMMPSEYRAPVASKRPDGKVVHHTTSDAVFVVTPTGLVYRRHDD